MQIFAIGTCGENAIHRIIGYPNFQSKDAFFHCAISSYGAMVLGVCQLDFNRYV